MSAKLPPASDPDPQSTPESSSGVDARVPDPAPNPVLAAGSTVELRKPHACGGLQWNVTRIGADVGLRCLNCGRLVLIPRLEFQRRLSRIC